MSTQQDGLNQGSFSNVEKPSPSPIEVLADKEGSVALGWVAPGVLYSRFMNGLSLELGTAYVSRLQALVAEVPSLHYFADAGALEFYDLAARRAFLELVLANRRKFTSLVMLTWSQGLTPASRVFAAQIGEPCEIYDDSMVFDSKLLRAAPQVRKRLDPKTWVPMMLPELSLNGE
jgi:hypothetical protein